MNTIIQYIHRPNSTELGKGNTHECYLLASATIRNEISELMPINASIEFLGLEDNKRWVFRATGGREFRINQFSDIYSNYAVEYGDEIILQKHIVNESVKRYVGVKKMNAIGLIKFKPNKYEIANHHKYSGIEDGLELNVIYDGLSRRLQIRSIGFISKRDDSPDMTKAYEVYLDNVIQNKSFLLFIRGESNTIVDYNKYEYHKITWEE